MKILETSFKKNGFNYEQVTRQGEFAIYRQTKEGQSWEAFEIAKINKNEAREVFGRQILASESWPRSEDWGVLAYTCTALARANERFRILSGQNA